MKLYNRLFHYVPDGKHNGYIAVILSAISAISVMYGYLLLYRFLRNTIIDGDFSLAKTLSLKTVFFLTIGALMYFLSSLFAHKLGFRLETNLRKKGIDGLTNASFRFFDLNPSGIIRKTIDDNAAKTHSAVAHMIPDNSQAFLVPVLALVLAFYISMWVGIVILLLTALGALIFKKMRGGGEFMQQYQDSLQVLSGETVGYVRGMQVIKIFRANVESFKNLYKAIKNNSKYALDYAKSCKRPYILYQWLFFGAIAIIVIPLSFLLHRITEPRALVVELFMVLFLSGVMMISFMRIMWAKTNMFNAQYALDSLETIYGEMQKDKLAYGKMDTMNHYNIDFDHVTFRYGDNKIFDNLSFQLEEGKIYALVGHSGSGKSTIAKLLSGFYKIDAGEIKIGGRSLEDYTKETLINNISFIFQESKLFKKSIYDNVALANKTASREEVMEAIRLSGCDEIINKFEEKEQTMIGSSGVYLSGGEKQRINIARAMLKNSKILIMDEANASIDPDNEYELQNAFKKLMKGKTVIMIAHRLSSIRSVDEILLLENGKIIERGTDKELVEKGGKYKELVALYDNANEWRVQDERVL
ncbi:MAG: ABC transporter ATP-binding protein [Eubacteriales bacterium]|nr:ABC transporter ATP-binding protein [Eubacteriales bacterium]